MWIAKSALRRKVADGDLMRHQASLFIPCVQEESGRLHVPRSPALAQHQFHLMGDAWADLRHGAGEALLHGAMHMTAKDALDLRVLAQ